MDEDLKGLLGKLVDKVDSLNDKVGALQAGQEALRADVTELRAGQDSLWADVAVLQSGQEELRRVTSSNHFRVMGKIELLSDLLTKHIGDHGHDPAHGAGHKKAS